MNNGESVRNAVVSNCVCEANSTAQSSGGAAIYTGNMGALNLINCKIENCRYTTRGFTSWGASGAVRVPDNYCTASNCCFRGNKGYSGTAILQAAPHSANTKTIRIANCLFDGNSVSASEYGNGYVRNCCFTNGATLYTQNATVSSCYFADNGGPALTGCGTLTNCVFVRNTNTSTGWSSNGGAVSINNKANCLIADCLFLDNAANTSGFSGCGAGAIRITSDTKKGATSYYTNLVIRNCYFRGNTGPTRDISIQNLRGQTVTPTFENHYGLNIESCTFADGISGSRSIDGQNQDAYSSYGSVFVRNCHFTGNPGKGTVHDIYTGSDAVQYCVADTNMTGLSTAEAYHNYYGKRTRNKGQNQAWMDGAQDLGDGTYTIGKSADWGITVTINNRKHRVCNQTVDAGCFEVRNKGLVVIIF